MICDFVDFFLRDDFLRYVDFAIVILPSFSKVIITCENFFYEIKGVRLKINLNPHFFSVYD